MTSALTDICVFVIAFKITPESMDKTFRPPVTGTNVGDAPQPIPTTVLPLNSSHNEPAIELSMTSPAKFLHKLKVFIRGFDEERQIFLVQECKLAGADVIEDENYIGEVDLSILPVDAVKMEGIMVTSKLTVNHLWLVSFFFITVYLSVYLIYEHVYFCLIVLIYSLMPNASMK